MPDGQPVVAGRVSRAEAGPAEGGPHDRAGLHQIRGISLPGQVDEHGLGGGIDRQDEFPVPDVPASQEVRCLHDIRIVSAGASGDDALLHPELSVRDLIPKREGRPPAGNLLRFLFHLGKDILQVRVQLVDGIRVGGMEGQGDHGPDFGQIDINAAVVPGGVRRVQLLIILLTAVGLQEGARLPVRPPDGGKAGGLRRHDIHAVAEVRAHGGNAGPNEFHDLVFHISVAEHRADESQGDILGPDEGLRLTVQINADHVRPADVVGILQQLLDQLPAALADRHGSQRAVPSMAVRAQNHLSAAGVHLPHVLVNDGNVGRNKNAPVLFRGGEAEHMVVLIDGSAHGAQGVVAVCQHVGHGEMIHPRSLRGLYNPHERDVMGSHGVKAKAQLFHIVRKIVLLQNGPGDGPLPGLLPVRRAAPGGIILLRLRGRDNRGSFFQKYTAVVQSDHSCVPSFPLTRASILSRFPGHSCFFNAQNSKNTKRAAAGPRAVPAGQLPAGAENKRKTMPAPVSACIPVKL